MTIDFIRRLIIFCALCLAQALVLNQIHLFGCATPLLYIYMITAFPCNYPKWATLCWAFLLGLSVDTFSNTPGVCAASLTALAAVQPYYLSLFIPAEAREDVKPTMRDMTPLKYSVYIIVLVLLYCMLYFSIEMFTFFNLVHWTKCVLGSTAITLLLIFTLESIQRK